MMMLFLVLKEGKGKDNDPTSPKTGELCKY